MIQNKYGINAWYYLTANLTLDFTCLDENTKANTSAISQTYDMYFANDGSNLNEIVNAVAVNIEEKLKVIKSVNIEYDKWDDSFVNQEQDVLNKINADLKTKLNSITSLTIDTQAIDNPLDNDYNYMSSVARSQSLHLISSKSFISDSKDFEDAWSFRIANRQSGFVNNLNAWEKRKNLTIDEKVFVFGNYQTNNWKISGSEIKSLSVPYYITSKDTTRASNATESLAILEKLFVGSDSLFKPNKNYNKDGGVRNFTIFLNPVAYDDFKKRDVTIQEIYDYVTKQTINAGKTAGFIKDTDKIKWKSGTNINNWLNIKLSDFYAADQYQNWRLVINGNAFSMHPYVDTGFEKYNYLTNFNFKKGDSQHGI